jgi:hypothetical protein
MDKTAMREVPLAERFRAAVSSGEFERAGKIWNSYCAERLVEVRAGCGDRLPEMAELLEWARMVAACARAQALHTLGIRLNEVHAAGAYGRAAW